LGRPRGRRRYVRATASAGDVVSKETIDEYFRLEWSKTGRKVNGYVYNSSNRRAGHMQLLVESLDAAGAVVNRTSTAVRDVPPNNRAFFETSVAEAPSTGSRSSASTGSSREIA